MRRLRGSATVWADEYGAAVGQMRKIGFPATLLSISPTHSPGRGPAWSVTVVTPHA